MMQSSCLRCIVDIMDGRLNFRPHTLFLCKQFNHFNCLVELNNILEKVNIILL